jgi:putative flippase GtrA
MRLLGWGIVGTLLNVLFWFVYTQTGNIVYGIGITAAVSVAIVTALNMTGKRTIK